MPKRTRSAAPDGPPAKAAVKGSRSRASAAAPSKAWFEELYSGGMSADYKRYMTDEWGHEKRGDQPLFEKLCLEGAQAGLSWATILAKREGYRAAFRGFDISRCAALTDGDIDRLVNSPQAKVVRHRGKCASVAGNARATLRLIAEESAAAGPRATPPPHGWFDAYIWSFVGGEPQLNSWPDRSAIPTESPAAIAMSKALKRRGFAFVGLKICYSLMQSCGLVIDHPKGTPEWERARQRLVLREQLGPPTTGPAAKRRAATTLRRR